MIRYYCPDCGHQADKMFLHGVSTFSSIDINIFLCDTCGKKWRIGEWEEAD